MPPESIHYPYYSCNNIWTLKQRDVRRLKTAEMEFKRRTAGYSSLYHRRNEDTSIQNKIAQYEEKLLNHIRKIEDIRCPKQIPNYRPIDDHQRGY